MKGVTKSVFDLILFCFHNQLLIDLFMLVLYLLATRFIMKHLTHYKTNKNRKCFSTTNAYQGHLVTPWSIYPINEYQRPTFSIFKQLRSFRPLNYDIACPIFYDYYCRDWISLWAIMINLAHVVTWCTLIMYFWLFVYTLFFPKSDQKH